MGKARRTIRRIARSAAGPSGSARHRIAAKAYRRLRHVAHKSASAAGPSALVAYAELPESLRRPASKVVILADPTVRAHVPAWIRQFPSAEVYVVSAQVLPEWQLEKLGAQHIPDPDGKVNWRLKSIGPPDAIIDLMHHSIAEAQALFVRLFWHVAVGGSYVIDATAAPTSPFGADSAAWVTALLVAEDGAPDTSRRDRDLSQATSQVSVSRDLIVIGKRAKHYLKLRDAETNRILPAREPSIDLRILDRLPGGVFESRARTVSHAASVAIESLDDSIEYPPMFLRHYRGEIAMVANQLLFAGSTILSDSFRHHLEYNPKNPRITSVSTQFARIADSLRPKQQLAGNYYHIDSENSGHFGHLMTETLARLWAWPEAKRAIPDLKLIFRIRYPNERDPALERRVFNAFGIADDDIVWVPRPVLLESLVAATPMWHNWEPHYVHPEIKPRVWDPIADALTSDEGPSYDKIFVSRQQDQKNRNCRNARQVEEFFAAQGFEIVYPELFNLPTQAGIFANARVIAGFGGSAMFNVLFARKLETFILLTHEAYTARNEHLFTSVIGCEEHYFWSASDVAQPASGWSSRAYYSDWDFDFDRNGPELNGLLASL